MRFLKIIVYSIVAPMVLIVLLFTHICGAGPFDTSEHIAVTDELWQFSICLTFAYHVRRCYRLDSFELMQIL